MVKMVDSIPTKAKEMGGGGISISEHNQKVIIKGNRPERKWGAAVGCLSPRHGLSDDVELGLQSTRGTLTLSRGFLLGPVRCSPHCTKLIGVRPLAPLCHQVEIGSPNFPLRNQHVTSWPVYSLVISNHACKGQGSADKGTCC